jgi:hypothetical protein
LTKENAVRARPPFPRVIDSTMLATFRSCPQKFYQSYMEHWKPQGESIHLVAGRAFAKGLEIARKAFYEEEDAPDVAVGKGLLALAEDYGDFEAPEDSAKRVERVMGALEYYFDAYPLTEDKATPMVMPSGRRGIEFSFAEPLQFINPETREPVIYSGRSDMIANWAEGIYVEDDKTATQLGASWSRQWDLRSQFTGYCWAARKARIPVAGVLVRGVSILKTKYDTQQAITYRSDWEIARWETQVIEDLRRIRQAWESGYWDWNLDHACSEYGGCAFQPICKSPAPEQWLPVYFERRQWDPLTRTETLLPEPKAA